MKFFINKVENFAENFTSKIGKFIAFWGAIVFFFTFLGGMGKSIMWFYYTSKDISNISKLKTEFENEVEYSLFLDMQEVSGLHEEMETVILYGIELQKTNNGDLWWFSTVEVNGFSRPVIYSANIKKKGKMITMENGDKRKAHIYIQNMKGVHRWIPDNL